MAKDRTCRCCNTTYSYCPSCSNVDKLKPTWYTDYCSEECMTLWTTAVKVNMNMLTKEEAKDIIKTLELKDKSVYKECIQRDLKNILEEDVEVVEIIETPIQEVPVEEAIVLVEEPIVEETVEPSAPPVVEAPPVSYKKNKKNRQKSHAVVKKEDE